MCPNIDANLYAANFENTKASMAILAKKQDHFPRHIQLNMETKRTEPRTQFVVVNLTTVNGLRVQQLDNVKGTRIITFFV